MNIKKIIPISLAAMSVMGSFTACSDNKVVGADEQANSVAVHLEEKEIASKAATLLKESSKPNVATTVIQIDFSISLVFISSKILRELKYTII